MGIFHGTCNKIIEHESYLNALIDYIIADFRRFRIEQADDTVGAMIVEQFPKIVDKCLIKFIVLMNVLNMMKMIFCRSAYNVMKGVEI